MTHHKNPTELTPEVPTKIVFMTPEVKPGFTGRRGETVARPESPMLIHRNETGQSRTQFGSPPITKIPLPPELGLQTEPISPENSREVMAMRDFTLLQLYQRWRLNAVLNRNYRRPVK